MRFLSLAMVGGLALVAAGCGLDSNGLGSDDGGGGLLTEAAAPPLDGTLSNEGAADVTAPPGDTAPPPDDSSGEDVATNDDANGEGGGTDAASDTGSDAGQDSGTDSGDSGADSGSADAGDDAADSACPGTCTVATVPAGWSIVEYAETSRPACSNGYGASVDVVEGPSGAPATCGCECNLTATGTCESSNFGVSVDIAGGPFCLTSTVTSPVDGGGCTAASANYMPSGNPKMKVTPAPYVPGSCTPDPSVTVTPSTVSAQGRFCASGAAPVGTCPNGGSCAPTPAGFSLCIKHDGTQTCPSGFTLPAHIVGSGVQDTRGCTPCSCGTADAGCSGTLTLFTDSACTNGAQTATVDDSCDPFPGPKGGGPGAPTYVAYEYSAHAQGEGCPPSPVQPDGGVALTAPHTVCCQ